MLQIDFAIKLLVPLFLFVLFRHYRLPPRARLLLPLYAGLVLYSFAIALMSENPSLVVLNTAKFLYVISFLVVLFLIYRPENFTLNVLSFAPYVGAIFAIQTIAVFLMVQTGHPPAGEVIIYTGYKDMPVLSYGWLGYGSAIMAAGTHFQLYRAQSFFMEPTRLACFLESSVLLGVGLYKVRRRKFMLFCVLLCAISFVLTFSTGANIVVLLTVIFYLMVRYGYKVPYLAPIATIVMGIFAVVAVVYYIRMTFDFYDAAAINMAFGRSDTELTVRIGYFIESVRLFVDYPLGIGLIAAEDSSILAQYPGAGDVMAPMVWLKIAGFIGLALQLVIVGVVLKVVVRFVREGGIKCYIGLAFFATALHHCIAGNWFSPMFFFLLVTVLMTDAFNFQLAAPRGHVFKT
jgi:hypothetical protein